MSSLNSHPDESALDLLFRAYRDACPAPEPSPQFMPRLWQRIEARQRYSSFFGRVARRFVTAGVALSLGMALYLAVPTSYSSLFTSESYVEALAGGRAADALDLELLHSDPFPVD